MQPEKDINRIQINGLETAQTVFTDIMELQILDDTVCLTIAIRNKDGETAMASHKIYMTLPHFFRFSSVCQKTADSIQEEFDKLKK